MRLVIVALFVLVSGSALANPALDSYLASIDGIPTDRAELERTIPDAHAALMAAAQEEGRAVWQRLRAIAFLSFYPDDQTYALLDKLIGATSPDIRRAAVYSLGRTFGTRNAKVADRVADIAENDPVVDVAEHAVRALRWVDGATAEARLARIGVKRPALKGLTEQTMERRAKRLGR